MSQKPHQDQRFVEGLSQNNSTVIKEIYKLFVPKVIRFIQTNSGDEDRAQDVVQDVLMTIYDQAKTKNLQLSCPFDAYFFLLCKRKWLNELKKKSNQEVTISIDDVFKDESVTNQIMETTDFEEKKNLFDYMFQKLGDKCKELLTLSFTIKSMEEVAEKLGVTYAYVRKKKSLCTGQLTEMIKDSNEFKRLKK
jgi:RNA polymerase sigma factor (sigma-70 family)